MYRSITPEVLASEAIMTLSAVSGVVVLVEGPSDFRMFKTLLPADSAQVMYSINRDIALGALSIVEQTVVSSKRNRVIGLVDADFSRILREPVPERAVQTDFHDIDTVILWSQALERWLDEYCSPNKLESFGGVIAVRRTLERIGGLFGGLRLYAARHSIPVDFASIEIERFVDKKSLELNEAALSQSIWQANRSLFATLGPKDLIENARTEVRENASEILDVVQGHDLHVILGVMMRNRLASFSSSESDSGRIAASLRLAFRPEDWNKTRAAADLYGLIATGLAR